MWFKNLQLYRLPTNADLTIDELEARLAAEPLRPCGATDPQTAGWVTPHGDTFVHSVNGQWLIALGVEQRLLPTAVVKQHVSERARTIEENEGRRPGKKELRDLREAITLELLPRAFVRRRSTYAWIDPLNGWLAIDAGAPAKADELIEHLHKSVDGFPARLLKTVQSPSGAMTAWVADGEPPSGFTIDQDIEMRSAEDGVIRYTRHSLEGKELQQHIHEGKMVTRLGLTWGDRISFVLNEKTQVKRLDFLDILKEESEGMAENEDERFDLDFALMTGELARLLRDLLTGLGGEVAEQA